MVTNFKFPFFQPYYLILLVVLVTGISCKAPAELEDRKGFYNHSGCLYAYQDGGNFTMNTEDGEEIDQELTLHMLSYESSKSKCSAVGEPGKLVFTYKLNSGDDNKTLLKSVSVSLSISTSPSEGTWEISQANLTIIRADIERKRNFQLKVNDLYAGLNFSFSCYELKLHTVHKKKAYNATGRLPPSATITLKKFQLQPFGELDSVVFAPSYDCSTWMSIPGLMGFVLILFMTGVTMIGVTFLKNMETNDFKYNKEGIQFTQSQLDANKHLS